MYNCRQPRASHWGLALAGTRGVGNSLGHEGGEFSLQNERVSQCEVLHQLQVGKEVEQHLLQEPGKVEAARAVSSQPSARGKRGSVGDLLSLHHLVPTREGMDAG